MMTNDFGPAAIDTLFGGLSHGFDSPRNGKIDARCHST